MRRLHYAGGYVLTADALCKAVLRYSRALAVSNTADVISIPVMVEGGKIALAHMLVGPASQLYSTPVLEALGEFSDQGVVEDLERLTASLQPSRPDWPDEMVDIPDIDLD